MKFNLLILLILTSCHAYAQNISENDLLNFIQQDLYLQANPFVVQEGNDNTAVIYGNKTQLIQNGDDQSFYYTETSIVPSELKVNMEGTGNYLEIFGNNGISENMQINLTGNDRSIIIRNYP